jgi:TRAP-type C4-dicarboxylate transport system substrate-binding protein
MRVTSKRVLLPAMAAALLGAFAVGCSRDDDGGGDKAGGSSAPTVLRLAAADDADQPDARFVRRFASRVSKLSGGSLRVRVVWDAAGQQSAGYEARIARLVKDGEFELGWMGARSWDRLGITSFQALQAPFLVTDHALLGRIAAGPLGTRMLAGLDGEDFVGLALVPDRLRYPFGVRHALASPDDFAGARVRVFPSRATDALIRALGATPVHISGDDVSTAVRNRELDGTEAALGTNSPDEGENFLTTNLALFPKTLTLFAGRDTYDQLDDEERAVIRRAARQTAAYAAAHPLSETQLMRDFCEAGPAVAAASASRADLAALRRAAQPVYAELERDPRTRELIAAIRELKLTIPAAAGGPLPGCARETPVTSGHRRPASMLNGTYHWRVTSAGARKAARLAGGPEHSEDVGSIGKMTLRDGGWVMGDIDPEDYSGTYEIVGNRLVFEWSGATLTFSFNRHAGGDIELEPIPPMASGDAVVWAGGRWRLVGPPVREIPSRLSARAGARQLGGHARATSGRAVDIELAADRLDSIGEPAQSRTPTDHRPADAVVGDLHAQPVSVLGNRDDHARGTGVLDDVRERLRADEIGRGRDLLG